jgi:hypothetical protein
LVGTDVSGRTVTVPAASVKGGGPWQLVFPGVAQGRYTVRAVGPGGADLPNPVVVTEHTPVLIGLTPDQANDRSPVKLELTGRYLRPDDKVELVPDKGKPVQGTMSLEKGDLEAALSFPSVDPGRYSLQVTSGKGKVSRIDGAFRVLTPPPVILALHPDPWDAARNRRYATVKIENGTSNMRAFLFPSGQPPNVARQEILISWRRDDEFSLGYPADLKEGSYDLAVVNDEGTETVAGGVVDIKPPILLKFSTMTQEEKEPVTLTVKADGIGQAASWQLIGTDSTGRRVSVPAISVLSLVDGWQLVFPGMPQGTYYVHATTSEGKQVELPKPVAVTEHTPVLVSFSPGQLDRPASFSGNLTGLFVGPDAKVELVSDKDGSRTSGTPGVSENASVISLHFKALEPGVYHLEVTSAKGKSSRIPRALVVLMPAPLSTSGPIPGASPGD